MNQQIETEEIRQQLKSYGLELNNKIDSYTDLLEELSYHINHIIKNDFNKLIQILYQLDVNEEQLRKLLKQQKNNPAADSIAKLIIERQQIKIQMKASFKKDENIAEDEKW